MGVRRSLALVALLAVSTFSGCSDDPGPGRAEVPADVGPTLPSAMSRDDAKGARAFIRYFWAMTNHAQATGDTSMLEKLAAGPCTQCDELVSRIDRVQAAGGSMRGGKHVVVGQQPLSRDVDRSAYSVIVDLRTTRQQVIESEGADPVTTRKSYQTLRFDVRNDEGQWLMVGWHDQEVE